MHFPKNILIITALAASALASRAAVVSLTVESAADYAIARNPSLAAARIRIEEARGRVDSAGRRANPELEFEFIQNTRTAEHGFSVAWMQKFPRTARLAIEKSVSRAELAAATAEISDAERRLAGEVSEAAVRILAMERERELLQQHIANTKELSAFLAERAKRGEISPVDASLAELEARQLSISMLQLNANKAALFGTLRPLLGVPGDHRLSITGTLGAPLPPPAQSANLAVRGDIQAAQAAVDAARHRVELAKASRWEDFTAGIVASHERFEDLPTGFRRESTIGLRFNLPLPGRAMSDGVIREAHASAQRSAKEADAVIALARAEAAAARAAMEASGGILRDIDRLLIPQARQIEEQLKAAYESGQTALIEVLRARGRRFELETQRVNALRDWNLAHTRYKTAKGGGK